jgi:hypothetical protein
MSERAMRYPRAKTGRYSVIAAERAWDLKQENPKSFARLPRELREAADQYKRFLESLLEPVRVAKPLTPDLCEAIRQMPELKNLSLPELHDLPNSLVVRALRKKKGDAPASTTESGKSRPC